MKIEVGKTYQVDHRRKGRFTLRVDKVDDLGQWVEGTVVEGEAQMRGGPNATPGQTVVINKDLAQFTEVPQTA